MSQTASLRAEQVFADLLRDEQRQVEMGLGARSYLEGLTRANRERMAGTDAVVSDDAR